MQPLQGTGSLLHRLPYEGEEGFEVEENWTQLLDALQLLEVEEASVVHDLLFAEVIEECRKILRHRCDRTHVERVRPPATRRVLAVGKP